MKTLFLPGAIGSASFWEPVADLVRVDGVFFSWPGLGAEPARPDVRAFDDLVSRVATVIAEPVNIVAQSMGGVVALRLALSRPRMVKRLVLAATSGGLPVADLGGVDWRRDYFAAFPGAAAWIADPVDDLSPQIPAITAPTLLLWGDADPISPVAVGERLFTLLPDARFCVIPGGTHDFARTHAARVAAEMERHLAE